MKDVKYIIALLAAGSLLFGCRPYHEDGIELPGAPSASFTWSYMTDDPNTVIFQSTADGFIHFWDFDNGITSNEKVDTVFFPQAGQYEVVYSASNAGGMGTATQLVDIAMTVESPCEGTLELLTGCDNQKTWVFSQEAAAIGVGPDPYDISWYASPASGLVPEQYDDSYQFTADGEYIYDNQLSTINPFEGYISTPLEVPELTYILSPGTGTSGEDQLILPTCWFMGVWDSGTAYDIVELTEDRLVVHAPIQNGDCSQGDGFFTLIFVAQ